MSNTFLRSIPLAALLILSAAACSNTADGVKEDASNAAEATAEAGAEAGSAMGGGAKTMDVKAALMADSIVSGMSIDVDTNNDTKTVTLTGTVPSDLVASHAVDVAKNNATGFTVVSKLTVRAP